MSPAKETCLSREELDRLVEVARYVDYELPTNLDNCYFDLHIVSKATGEIVASIDNETGDARVQF